MPRAQDSNVDKLKEAGLIPAEKQLNPEQTDAIDSLTSQQVDQLISLNNQLEDAVTSDDPVIVMPGRIAAKPPKP